MNKCTQDFLANLAGLFSPILSTHQETIDYWGAEEPPITIAFADVGRCIVQTFNEMDSPTRAAIFDRIETGMKSDDEQLGTAVATGLVEAIVGHAARLGNWEMIRTDLRPVTRKHADAWHTC
ncbi:MAG: hypothetical protein ABJK59_11060 [Erythrobacter sp.]|uniref:hypothetical protein n=1 Tax=Erythrobacter sp. TaxID=1042 RepID=UPI00329A33AB